MEIAFVSILLVVAIVLLVTEKIPVDVTALGIMAVLAATGILSSEEAVAGFANPAPITVGALFILSAGLMRTGATEYLTDWITNFTESSPKRLLLIILIAAGVLSAVKNNTLVVVIFMPIVLAVASKHGFAPSRYMMPLSFISILAGTCTLIGTSTNIIVSDLGAGAGLEAIGMFELAPLGVPIAVGGGILLYLVAFKILPAHRTAVLSKAQKEKSKYISELLIPGKSPLAGKDPAEGLGGKYPDVEVYEVIADNRVCDPSTERCILGQGDLVLVRGSAEDLTGILSEELATLPKSGDAVMPSPYDEAHLMVELIITPNSRFAGSRLAVTDLARDTEINIVGVRRHGMQYSGERLHKFRLRMGDIMLAQMPLDHIEMMRAGGDVIVVEDVVPHIMRRKKAPLAIAIFVGTILAASVGGIDILVATLVGAFLMVLTDCLSPQSAYNAIDVEVLILIVGTIALGKALSATGAAGLYANTMLGLLDGVGPRGVLAAFVILTSLLSHFISNNSAAVLVVPIAISTAHTLGVDPRPFLIGICFGASACYASPIGYQTNLLVYEPGKYKFTDFVKLGMPLNALVCAASSIFIPYIWPF
jgi:di/tricarboxylate transporter